MAANLQIVIAGKDEISRQLSDINKGLDSLGGAAKAAGVAVAGTLAAGFAGLTAAVGASVKTAADFEQSLANTRAATGATAKQMAAMREEALGIGKDTSKSASEAADAMGELVKAGVPVEKVIAGAARSVVQLAEATGSDVSEMAVLVSNAMNTFRKSALSAADATNLIAKTANASAITTTDFKFAMQALGPVAETIGADFEDVSAAIGIMGNSALRGSDAGTSLKTMLMNLIPETKEQNTLFRQLGLQTDNVAQMMALLTKNGIQPLGSDSVTLRAQLREMAGEIGEVDLKAKDASAQFEKWLFRNQALTNGFFDATGSMKPLAEVAGLLNDKLKDMTSEQQITYLGKLFGQDAVRAAAILMKEGANGVAAFLGELQKAPSVAEQSAMRLDTLNGVIEQIKGSIEVVAIGVGTLFLPLLKNIATGALGVVNGMNALIPVMETISKIFDAAFKDGEAFSDWLVDLPDWIRPVVQQLAILIDQAGGFGRAIKAMIDGEGPAKLLGWFKQLPGAIATAIDYLIRDLDRALAPIGAALKGWAAEFANWVGPAWDKLRSELGPLLEQFGRWIADTAVPVLREKLSEWGAAFWAWVDVMWPVLRAELAQMLTDMGNWIAKSAPEIGARLGTWTNEFAEWAKNVWGPNYQRLDAITDGIAAWMSQAAYAKIKQIFADALGNLGKDLGGNANALGHDFVVGVWDGITKAFSDPLSAAKAADSFLKGLQRAIGDLALGPLLGPSSTFYKSIMGFMEQLGIDIVQAIFKRLTGQDLPIGALPGAGGGGGTTTGPPPAGITAASNQARESMQGLMGLATASGTTAGGLRTAIGNTTQLIYQVVDQLRALGTAEGRTVADLYEKLAREGMPSLKTTFANLVPESMFSPERANELKEMIRRFFNDIVGGRTDLVPTLANGGFVPRPTLAIVGDRPGGEYVLGRDQLGSTSINFYGPIFGLRDVEDTVIGALASAERRGRIAVGTTR